MELVPTTYLVRLRFRCHFLEGIPRREDDRLLDLPLECRVENPLASARQPRFADVRVAWNDLGLGVQVEVRGKEKPPEGDVHRPQSSDGCSLWIDTRDVRNAHRASRYCHRFFFLPTGGGADRDEAAAGQLKINRALQDAPLCSPDQLTYLATRTKRGYVLEAFLPATVLQGFDPESHDVLGFYYWVHDSELGDQTLGLGTDFPFWEDPSLWVSLELTRD